MAAHVYLDRIETLEMKEKWGVIVSVIRKAFVENLPIETDWSVMYGVLDAIGVPSSGEYLDDDRASHLYVTDRNVKMTEKNQAEIIITYGHFADRGQKLFYDYGVVGDRNISGKMQASISQKTANMYREDGSGTPEDIIVEHTYPADDPDFRGKTISQTGEVSVQIPQKTMTVEGIKETDAPWRMSSNLIGCVNKREWLGEAAHIWMCTEVTWEYRDEGNYFMSFTFQENPDTWNPTAVFMDANTSKPPAGLIEGIGWKYIRYHKEVDFVGELGYYLIGPGQ